MKKKTHSKLHPSHHFQISLPKLLLAVLISSFVNAITTVIGLIVFMPCMISDALGSLTAMLYLKRYVKNFKLTKFQAAIIGGLSGLIGSFLFVLFFLVIYLAFGNLMGMTSNIDLFANSITGSGSFPAWLAIMFGMAIVMMKVIISAIVMVALSTLDSF